MSLITILTTLREKLVLIAQSNEWDSSDWSKQNHFRGYLEARKELLEYCNIRLGFKATADMKKVTLSYIDPSKIPAWKPVVSASKTPVAKAAKSK